MWPASQLAQSKGELKIIAGTDVQFSEKPRDQWPRDIRADACRLGLENPKSSVYSAGRSNDWVKKNSAQRETLGSRSSGRGRRSRGGSGRWHLGRAEASGRDRVRSQRKGTSGTRFQKVAFTTRKVILNAQAADSRPIAPE